MQCDWVWFWLDTSTDTKRLSDRQSLKKAYHCWYIVVALYYILVVGRIRQEIVLLLERVFYYFDGRSYSVRNRVVIKSHWILLSRVYRRVGLFLSC